MDSSLKYSKARSSSRWERFVAVSVFLLAFLSAACDTNKKKGAQEIPAEPAPAPTQPPSEAADAGKQRAEALQKRVALSEFRKQAGFLIAQPSHEAALVPINEALALDPQNSEFLRLKNQVSETLAHRCCGTWQRYDFTQPGAAKKDLHGVLWSADLGPNHRGQLFRGRVLLACGKGALSMRLRVPWEVPESRTANIDYTIGDAKGSETVKTDAAPFIYEFPEPAMWLQRLSESENQAFQVQVPKRDGKMGKFSFELGEAKKIANEVLSACK